MKRANNALSVAFAALVWLFFANGDANGDDIYVGNVIGNFVLKINSCHNASIYVPTLVDTNDPEGLAFDSNGNLYIAYISQIERYDPCGNGTIFAVWRRGVDVGWPRGLAVDASDNLYVANAREGVIQRIDPRGHSSVFAALGNYAPYGLAFDREGNLYVGNVVSNTIVKIVSSGHSSVFATANSGLNVPTGLAFDSRGNLYVANVGNSTIVKIDTNGVSAVFTTASSGLSCPHGLAFDDRDNLYVANYCGWTIERFDPQGNWSVFADASAGLRGPTFIAVRKTKVSISLLGNDTVTNECHVTYSEPGVTASEGGRTNIIVAAGDLQDATGTLMPTSAVAVLVADTGNNGFVDLQSAFPLSLGATWGADDKVVGLWNLHDSYYNYGGQPGLLADQAVVFYAGGI